ncbi:hypothetical protein ACIFOT_25660 [Neobacillus sp. NRS-1170]|uniref:hypothetical protein n=1 Tax=Neobacillus sp. NRS-1170 TaxID=3233898 RepID=UPI003D2A8FD0
MFDLYFILSGLVLLILVGGLLYTLTTGRFVSARQSEFDAEINEKTQRHPILLNPIFFAYIIGIVLVILYIFYHASRV